MFETFRTFTLVTATIEPIDLRRDNNYQRIADSQLATLPLDHAYHTTIQLDANDENDTPFQKFLLSFYFYSCYPRKIFGTAFLNLTS